MILFWSLVPGSNKSEWDHVVEVGFPNSRTNEQVSLFKLCLSLGEVDCFWVLWNETPLQSCNSKMCLSSSSSSALQLFMSFGLLNSFFPLFPLLHLLFPIFTPILPRSFLTSSSHLNLGLPFGLVAYGFHLYMILGTLSFVILMYTDTHSWYVILISYPRQQWLR